MSLICKLKNPYVRPVLLVTTTTSSSSSTTTTTTTTTTRTTTSCTSSATPAIYRESKHTSHNDTVNVHSVSVLDVARVSKLVSSVVGGSMHMWCLDDIGRDSWDRVVSGTCERA